MVERCRHEDRLYMFGPVGSEKLDPVLPSSHFYDEPTKAGDAGISGMAAARRAGR
jgi:hypothetical protein